VANPPEPYVAPSPETGPERAGPVLIPVTAEDVARRRRRIISAIVTAVVALSLLAAWIYKRSTDPLRAQESYDSGRRLFQVARYDQAILSFDRALALKPDFPEAWLMRARCYVSLYDPERAIPDFDRAVQLRANDTMTLIYRGRAHILLRDFPAAIADAAAALAIDAKLGVAYNLRGTAERGTGDPRKALDDFNRAVEFEPNADNYYQRGATHQLLGEHKLAIADFDRAIEFTPDMSQQYYARAESKRAIGDVEGAKKDHRQGLILDGR
jgi:tetratricopeptide (TPR) repeat protein